MRCLFTISLFFLLLFSVDSVAQKINQFDINGKRTGIWRKYYNNGKIRYKGQFLNGKEVGVFKFYSNTSATHPEIVKEFLPSSNKAVVKFYDENQKLKTKGEMIGKKREGKWIYYFSDRKIFSEENYKDGKLHGILKNYYPNGKLTQESNYKNGKRHGLSKIYTDEGVLIEELNYIADKLDGLAKYYDLKGNLKEKGNYKKGIRVGKWDFYVDGKISKKPKRNKYFKEIK